MTSTRCILPWIHQYGDIEGSYGLCCFTLAKKGSLFGKDKRPLDAFNDDSEWHLIDVVCVSMVFWMIFGVISPIWFVLLMICIKFHDGFHVVLSS